MVCLARIPRTKDLFSIDSNGLTITGHHPIRAEGKWTNAHSMANTTKVANPSGFVYNFVLDVNHVVLVNGVECVTWGHGFTEASVQHAFYGTEKIIDYLMTLPGWNSGQVDYVKNSNSKVTSKTV